jgi:DNA excision repair protein ERCC-4
MASDGYLSKAFEDMFSEDGLCVMARGCGINNLLSKFVQYYSYGTSEKHQSQEECKKLVFVLNLNGKEQLILDHLLNDGIPPHRLPRILTAESASVSDRCEMYLQGGCYIITSRCLIVDLLDNRLPNNSIFGIIIANAHKLTETCTETFILRVYKERYNNGFIKAFSDEPELLVGSFGKIERIMKFLWLKKLYLYPRFHEIITKVLNNSLPNVIEILLPLNTVMKTIQSAILVILNITINEIKKVLPTQLATINININLENSMYSNFETIIRNHLESSGELHKLNYRTRSLISDLGKFKFKLSACDVM